MLERIKTCSCVTEGLQDRLMTYRSILLTMFVRAQTLYCQNASDLQIQLKNLRESLYQAENIPGQKGLDQVKYYQKLIEEKEKELVDQGVDPEPEDKENAPWMHTDDLEKINYQSHQPNAGHKSALKDIDKEILNVEEKLNWLIQNRESGILNANEVANQINQLAEERESLLITKNNLREDPTSTIVNYKSKRSKETLDRDQKLKDPIYINILNEQLQSTFNQIYLLREQILEQTDGEAIKKLGNKISSLEQEEKTLKARIRAMGQSPLPPRVMSKAHQEHLKKGNTNQVEYDLKLKSFIQELSIKVDQLRTKLSKASSGTEISMLGQQLTLLNQQIVMAQEDLNELKLDKSHSNQSGAEATLLTNQHAVAPTPPQPQATKSEHREGLTQQIKSQQQQALWSEMPQTNQQAEAFKPNDQAYNAQSLAKNVEEKSQVKAEQIRALENINSI